MIIKNDNNCWNTPKNYSRKNTICTCLCIVASEVKTIEYVKVKYEVSPTGKGVAPIRQPKKKYKPAHQDWGTFKQAIEIPEIFNKLDDEDYTVMVGTFLRDNVSMPFISAIIINNIEKYNIIKQKEERRKKLSKIKDYE